MKKIINILSFLILVFSCEKKKEIKNETQNIENLNGIFILNEGNFGKENSSLSFYDLENKKIYNDIFKNVNKKNLGDVAQSIFINKNLAYIVVNNSQKIEIININNLKNIATINNLKSPRYFLWINENKAYVSDLYDKNIKVINPETQEVIKDIFIGSATEEMIKVNNMAFVCTWLGDKKITVIDTETDEVIKIINTNKEVQSIVLDKNDKIWAICSSSFKTKNNARLIKINTKNFEMEKEFIFDNSNFSPRHLEINSAKDTLFFIYNGICKMSIDDNFLPEEAFISNENRIFYNLKVIKNSIFVSYPVDYVQNAYVFQYNLEGEIKDTIDVKIIPSSICEKN